MKIRTSRDAKGRLHVFLPGTQFGKLLGATGLNTGMLRTVARGERTISVMRRAPAGQQQFGINDKACDCGCGGRGKDSQCGCAKDCGCGCNK